MKANIVWKEGTQLNGECGNHQVLMDAKPPIGKDTGPTPKELVAMGLAGCSAIDVIAYMKKYKQPMETFVTKVDLEQTEGGYPVVFKYVNLTYELTGNLDKEKLLESVKLSQTKYCGVSAMISKTVPIHYEVVLNGTKIGEGKAHFEK